MVHSSMTAPNRRDFLSAAAATAVAAAPGLVLGKDDRTFKIGLIGCGGRGTGATNQALKADPGVQVHALADLFPDRLARARTSLEKLGGARGTVPDERCFTGWDAAEKLIASGVDVVLLATPPHFRPAMLQACVDANVHVFCEKPVAVDATGVRSVLETCKKAAAQKSFVVSGLQWRYDPGMQETIQRLQGGAIGKIISLETTRYQLGVGKLAEREADWSDMYYQLRNWYYYTWLSGDFIVEQFIHEFDKMCWLMGGPPKTCASTGGRIARDEPKFGHVYDHFNSIFEWEGGVKLFAGTRHQRGCSVLRYDKVFGCEGDASLMKYTIGGSTPWRYKQPKSTNPKDPTGYAGFGRTAHQVEHDVMYQKLRAGEYLNNGEYMAHSTLMAIMARESAYTGRTLTWEMILKSEQDLRPASYAWDQPLPEPPVAIPGLTKFL